MTKLLTQSAKTLKSDDKTDYLTAIMYMKPYTSGGSINLCPMAETFKCHEACLVSSGMMRFSASKAAQQYRTDLYLNNKWAFWHNLLEEIDRFIRRCERAGKRPAIRLNGTTDIQWENLIALHPSREDNNIFDMYPNVTFYDYTKILKRFDRTLPSNYTLVFSGSLASEISRAMTLEALERFIPTALVFRDELPGSVSIAPYKYLINVINGDEHDLLPVHLEDHKSFAVVIGLKAKGKAKKDQSGFVLDFKRLPKMIRFTYYLN